MGVQIASIENVHKLLTAHFYIARHDGVHVHVMAKK